MAVFIEMLLVLGISAINAERIAALLVTLSRTKLFNFAATSSKLRTWVIRALNWGAGATGAAGIVNGAVKDWLSKTLGETIESLDKDAILHAGGRAAAKTFAGKIKEKYGIHCPIADFYSDMLAEELGDFMADVINIKISQAMNKDVEIFSTVMPADNVKSEIDAFMVSEINSRLNLHITSVLSGTELVTEIKSQIVDKLQQEMTNIIIRAKGVVVNNLRENGAGVMLTQDKIDAVNNAVSLLLATFSAEKVFGFNINAIQYYAGNERKIQNKMRQRAYRETHREQRVWVNK